MVDVIILNDKLLIGGLSYFDVNDIVVYNCFKDLKGRILELLFFVYMYMYI